MALQKTVISIPMEMGVDTKNDPVLINKARLESMQNGRFIKGANGQLQSRNGYQPLPIEIADGGTLSVGQALAQLNGEQDVIDAGFFRALSPTQQKWVTRAPITACVPSVLPIVRNNYDQTAPDSATLQNVTVYSWIDARGGVWFKVLDQ